MSKEVAMEDIVSLCKRRGFIYQGSEVYGGLAGTWDYGPLGVQLKRNVMNLWWKTFVDNRDDMYGVDAAILMNQKVWQASGHVDTFHDPLVEDLETKKRYRADHLLEDAGHSADGLNNHEIDQLIKKHEIKSPDGNELSDVRVFNMMFQTSIGPVGLLKKIEIPPRTNPDGSKTHTINPEDVVIGNPYPEGNRVYLRPETAQGIFTNYKNIVDSFYPDLPFGVAQMGKAFRNEISPRDFVFRSREFEQMEVEYFVHPDNWEKQFEQWRTDIKSFLSELGLPEDSVHEHEVPEEDRAHYSERTIDFMFDYPHKRDELLGLAYRTDFDLKNIQEHSGKSMEYIIKGTNDRFIPHVIEPSFGVERAIMAVLVSAFTQDEVNGETRNYLKLPTHLAPYRVAVSPLLKNKEELVKKAREVYDLLKKQFGNVAWDDNGNIGKRYRRQDEIGTPHCVVIDFDTIEKDGAVTVRNRDTTDQERVSIDELVDKLS